MEQSGSPLGFGAWRSALFPGVLSPEPGLCGSGDVSIGSMWVPRGGLSASCQSVSLTDPQFIKATIVHQDQAYDDKIYYFFREDNPDKNPEAPLNVSRVAQLCRVSLCVTVCTYVCTKLGACVSMHVTACVHM